MWLKIDLPASDWEYLEACARIRQISMRGLCTRLLHDIAKDLLVRAILDDDSQPTQGRKYLGGKNHAYRKQGPERSDACSRSR
jgi:hypothetical protein